MNKKNYIIIGIVFFLLAYFYASPVNIFVDTIHYQSYISIFEGKVAWANWDIVRGIVFPFIIYIGNLLFGKTPQGLLMLTFIFYILMLYCVKLVLDNCIETENKKIKKMVYILAFTYIIADPIVYGYYHALLTEFVAMTVSLAMCYLSWKWLHIDFFENKKKYIIYSVVFIFATAFAWHLKQPYVGIALFPVLVATIISLFKKFKLKNVIPRISTLLLCIIGLVLSITIWNAFLNNQGVNLNSNRNVTSSLGNMMLGINYKSTLELDNTKFLSDKEIEKLMETDDYKIINIYNPSGKLIDQEIVEKDKNNNISTMTAIKFLAGQLVKHPISLIDSYATTYLAIANVYPKTTPNATNYYVVKKLDLNYCHENCAVAMRVSTNLPNMVFARDDSFSIVEDYEKVNDSPQILKTYFNLISKVTLRLYKIIILILPVFSIASIVSLSKKKNRDNYKLLSMVTILSMYSFLHIMAHVATNANIDRYASPAYITTIVALVLYVYYLVIKREDKKVRSK